MHNVNVYLITMNVNKKYKNINERKQIKANGDPGLTGRMHMHDVIRFCRIL